MGRLRSFCARPGGEQFGPFVFCPVFQRPPWWRHLGCCLTPAPALEANLGRCTRERVPPKWGQSRPKPGPQAENRSSGSHCPGRDTPNPTPEHPRDARLKDSGTMVRGRKGERKKKNEKKKNNVNPPSPWATRSEGEYCLLSPPLPGALSGLLRAPGGSQGPVSWRQSFYS